jgi:hypothetical protein
MTEPTPPTPEAVATVRTQLQEVVPLLREGRHLDRDVQQALADLVDELIRMMDPHAPADSTAHLAESSTQLVRALHRKQHTGMLAAAKARLEEAATRAEAEAPMATGLARRLIDTLSNLGI